jgi:threonine/homoserine/homoserine lactone efflux protein
MWAMFAIVMGLLFAMIGVGMVEASMTNMEMFYGVVWALNGLVFLWIGVSFIKGETDE